MLVHEKYMLRCIQLAANGLGNAAPNPLVGALIVHDGKIAGEGFHQRFGEAHAEVNAINHAIAKHGENSLQHSTLYVNLEPCSHFGKTPPCVDLIIEKGIPKVVIGTIDPFAKVNGAGIKKLGKAGVEVVHPVLENECRELNKRFFTFHEKKRPYIILKYAQSADGYIAPEKITDENKWISNEYSRQLVHKWRSEEQAIMIGTNTARIDNPFLTVREWSEKNPVRIVIDKKLKLNTKLNMFDNASSTLIYNSVKNETVNNLEFVQVDFNKTILPQILGSIYKKNIQSVIVEGGTKLLQSFINENLWDEARIITGDKIFGGGIKCPVINGKIISEGNIMNDKLLMLIRQ